MVSVFVDVQFIEEVRSHKDRHLPPIVEWVDEMTF